MLTDKQTKHFSKFLSLVLRHKPELIGIELDEAGWTDVRQLIIKSHEADVNLSMDTLKYIVETNSKKRFAFNANLDKIRASQGHSLAVDLGYVSKMPPDILFHGTVERFLDSILKQGLRKQDRHHVHLSSDIETAKAVGQRHGKPVVIHIRSGQMHQDGLIFWESENGVWLTDNVPVKYLTIP